jgi:DNA-directed RNA polymerase subunit RPC12/RpoP
MNQPNPIAAAPSQRQFPCSQCGAELKFEPGESALVCPYCHATTQIQAAGGTIERLSYDACVNGAPDTESASEKLTVHCSACGAQTQLGANLTADKCVFCGSPVVANRQSQRLIKPRALLPFRVERAKAQADFKAWLAGLWFAPGDLLAAAECGGLAGVYIPFWTFDADAETAYAGERGEDYFETETYTEYENGHPVMRTREVRRTRWWPVSGVVQNHFDDLLVAASSSLPPKQTAHLEPWDLQDLLPYADEYLAGFAAESYQVDLPSGFSRAQAMAEPIIRQSVDADIGGDHQRIVSMENAYQNVMFRHILLPLWISAYSYHGRSYRFLINARTGAVQGERPFSFWKIFLLILFVVIAIITMAVLQRQMMR